MKINWTQNIVIMEAKLDIDAKHWYLQAVQQFDWSKTELVKQIHVGVYFEIDLGNESEICYTENDKNIVEIMSENDSDRFQRSGNEMPNDDFTIKLLRLGLSEAEKERYYSNIAENNKITGRLLSEAKKRSKQSTCYVCGNSVSSFCNSHSVPQFCLRRIAVDGKVLMSGIQQDFPYLGADTGIKSAGTFQIICRECDNTIFQQYENPASYDKEPTGQMLAQIAMKNYLQMIYKRIFEKELFALLKEQNRDRLHILNSSATIDLDLAEFKENYLRAKIASNGHHDDWYYLFYHTQLDYTVPFAFQGAIALISDFEDRTINRIFDFSNGYRLQYLNLAVFPLERSSAIFAFIDKRHNRYRSFIKKMKSLDLQSQLSIINYIIFKYSENVFLSKAISEEVLKNRYFLDACRTSNVAKMPLPFLNPMQIAIEDFSLSKHTEIPNLLDSAYAI